MNRILHSLIFGLGLPFVCSSLAIAAPVAREVAHFSAPEAHQGVAVDEDHFYTVTNRAVGKYDLATGKKVAEWKSSNAIPLTHLNSGVVKEGRLYCAHSNWPHQPLVNSIQMWDAKTLKHAGAIQLDETAGAMNWVDQWDGDWYGVYAYYDHGEDASAKAHVSHTRLVKFDGDWQVAQSWTFPELVWRRFAPSSNSGGCFSTDGTLYATGHDHAELYHLRLPEKGSVLEYIETVPAPIAGQGIAWQPGTKNSLFGIRRAKREVVRMKIFDSDRE